MCPESRDKPGLYDWSLVRWTGPHKYRTVVAYTYTHKGRECVAACYYSYSNNNNNEQDDLRFSLTYTRLSFYEQPVSAAFLFLLIEMWRLYSLRPRLYMCIRIYQLNPDVFFPLLLKLFQYPSIRFNCEL